jgi:hypothetical protein
MLNCIFGKSQFFNASESGKAYGYKNFWHALYRFSPPFEDLSPTDNSLTVIIYQYLNLQYFRELSMPCLRYKLLRYGLFNILGVTKQKWDWTARSINPIWDDRIGPFLYVRDTLVNYTCTKFEALSSHEA